MRPTESMPVSVPTPAEGFDLLLEAGRAAVYRRNAFRITQLAVDATPREITRQTEKLRLLEKLGGGARAAGGLGLDPPPDQDAVREALQRLRDPERRLVDELFWFWPQALGQATSDPALQALERGDVAGAARQWLTRERDGSEGHVSMHNLAVLSHATALDLEHGGRKGKLAEERQRERDRCWEQGLKRWRVLLDQEGFWSRLTARIRELDDPRLTTGTGRRLRAALPLALLRINAHLAVEAAERGAREEGQRHLGIMRGAGFAPEVGEEALRQAVEPLRARIQTLCRTAEAEAGAAVAQADRVARRLLKQTQPLLGVLDGVLAAGHPLREGAHDEVALRALACQIAYGNKTEDWGESKALLEATLPVAASESARGRIQENLTIVSANLEHQQLVGKCWFCKTRQPETSAAIEVKMHGDIKRLPIPGGVRVTWQHAAIKVPRCKLCHAAHEADVRWWAWYSFTVLLYWIVVPIGLIRFIPRFRRNPTPAVGRYLGLCVTMGLWAVVVIGSIFDLATQRPDQPPPPASTTTIVLRFSLLLAVAIGLMTLGGWYGRYLRRRRGLSENVRPEQARPLKYQNEFPLIKERLGQGWQFGGQPVG